jgi:pimeloyl-ACP methyl ester carboxylesterase
MVRSFGRASGQATDRFVLFAHATGAPSAVYDSFLAIISRDSKIPVFSFDMRGFGDSKNAYS